MSSSGSNTWIVKPFNELGNPGKENSDCVVYTMRKADYFNQRGPDFLFNTIEQIEINHPMRESLEFDEDDHPIYNVNRDKDLVSRMLQRVRQGSGFSVYYDYSNHVIYVKHGPGIQFEFHVFKTPGRFGLKTHNDDPDVRHIYFEINDDGPCEVYTGSRTEAYHYYETLVEVKPTLYTVHERFLSKKQSLMNKRKHRYNVMVKDFLRTNGVDYDEFKRLTYDYFSQHDNNNNVEDGVRVTGKRKLPPSDCEPPRKVKKNK